MSLLTAALALIAVAVAARLAAHAKIARSSERHEGLLEAVGPFCAIGGLVLLVVHNVMS